MSTTVIKYNSYAKINLYLDVLNKRRDGYNNIETIFQTVDLADELVFEEQHNGITMTCSSSELDTGEGNLVYRAAALLREHTDCRMGARIHLEKRIPVAAGLAGGSGNAAAALVALNTLWDLRLPKTRLHDLALQLGSDVPYCMQGGTAAATRRGEELTTLPVLEKVWFVLVHPAIAVSASHTYNHEKLGRSAEKPFAGRTPAFRRAIRNLQQRAWEKVVFNRMEAPVFYDHPHLGELKKELLALGCVAAAVSGSGPTLFGVCTSKRAAQHIAGEITTYPTSVVTTTMAGVERMV